MVFLVVGFELGFSVIAGIILGEYVDKWLQTKTPWFTILGLVAGVITGFSLLIRMMKRFDDTKGNLELIDTAFVQDLSVVSSGDYQRFYEVDGIRYHHLIDPHTLMPATYHRAVTIFADDSGYADFLSTAVFLMPYDTGRNLVEKLDGVDAFWVLSDGSVKATTNAMEMLKILGGATNE